MPPMVDRNLMHDQVEKRDLEGLIGRRTLVLDEDLLDL